MTYFDWNATAPLHPDARKAWLDASEEAWGNPSTSYRTGVRTRLALEEARESVAEWLGCSPANVIFTSGATEANNGVLREASRRSKAGGRVWISAVEHPSVTESARAWWGPDRLSRIPVTRDGVIDLDWLADNLSVEKPELVSLMAANNETGVIQPWQAVRDLCREAGIAFHCDAVQWIAKEPWEPWEGCSAMTLSAHKFGGPKGVGCLVVSDEWLGINLQAGGAQEQGMRSGTENVPAVLSMVAAMRARHADPLPDTHRSARDQFEDALLKHWPEDVQVNGARSPRLWNTTSLALPDFASDRWIARLDKRGFAVSSGSACSTGKSGPSSILLAMGVPEPLIRRTVRISSGWETSPEEWKQLLEAIEAVHDELSSEAPPSGPGNVIEI